MASPSPRCCPSRSRRPRRRPSPSAGPRCGVRAAPGGPCGREPHDHGRRRRHGPERRRRAASGSRARATARPPTAPSTSTTARRPPRWRGCPAAPWRRLPPGGHDGHDLAGRGRVRGERRHALPGDVRAGADRHLALELPDRGRRSARRPGADPIPITSPRPFPQNAIRIQGTPITEQTTTVTLRGTDANGLTATRTYTFRVDPPRPLTITPHTWGPLVIGSPQNLFLDGDGGVKPYAWSISAGALPPGMAVVQDSAGVGLVRIGGTPTATGTYSFTLRLTDARGTVLDRAFTVVVQPAPIPTLLEIAVTPTVVGGATPIAGVRILPGAPPGGSVVVLTSSNPSVASVPAGVTVGRREQRVLPGDDVEGHRVDVGRAVGDVRRPHAHDAADGHAVGGRRDGAVAHPSPDRGAPREDSARRPARRGPRALARLLHQPRLPGGRGRCPRRSSAF